MLKEPAYFDSQAQAAAALNIDIYKLREAKREGCAAFRGGRVYRDELLKWFADKRFRRVESALSSGDETKKRLRAGAHAMLYLTYCANLNILTDDQFFNFGRTIVEAVGDEEMLQVFIEIIFQWLCQTFPELSDAYKAHPKIVDWLCAQGGAKYGASESA
jgi:hypothetical protein